MKNTDKKIQIDNELLNAITPFGGIEFFRNRMYLGENIARLYAITKYPATLRQGWASRISNIPNVITTQLWEPSDNIALISDLSASVNRNLAIAESTRDALTRQRALKSAEDAERLMKRIDENAEVVGYMSNLAMVIGRDEEELEKSCRNFESTIATLNCRARILFNQSKEGFRAVSPYGIPEESILKQIRRNVPMSSFIEGFPFASNNFTDFEGYPFARNSEGGLVVLDIWKRGADRTNSNFAIFGVPGVGKSTTCKHLMMNEYMMGTTCIVIDPEREYAELTSYLGGDLINAGGGSFIMNPLQFKSVPLDDNEDDLARLYHDEEGKGLSAMALHFKTLEVFFSLYDPDMNTIRLSLLKQLLEMLYNSFDIDWDTDPNDLSNVDYPIMEDLYKLVQDVKKSMDISKHFEEELVKLEVIIRELAVGADSFIFNGHTTVEPHSNFICLDTFELQESSANVRKAQYYNLLTWTWERISRDRSENAMLFCDEAYILVDPHVPQTLIYLRNIAKRARKYSAGLCVITHSATDFLDESVRMYGQALLDLPTYKILMGTDGQNLIDLDKLYFLSEREKETLENKKRGVAILIVGSKRFIVYFVYSDFELSIMGSGGGK